MLACSTAGSVACPAARSRDARRAAAGAAVANESLDMKNLKTSKEAKQAKQASMKISLLLFVVVYPPTHVRTAGTLVGWGGYLDGHH